MVRPKPCKHNGTYRVFGVHVEPPFLFPWPKPPQPLLDFQRTDRTPSHQEIFNIVAHAAALNGIDVGTARGWIACGFRGAAGVHVPSGG